MKSSEPHTSSSRDTIRFSRIANEEVKKKALHCQAKNSHDMQWHCSHARELVLHLAF